MLQAKSRKLTLHLTKVHQIVRSLAETEMPEFLGHRHKKGHDDLKGGLSPPLDHHPDFDVQMN